MNTITLASARETSYAQHARLLDIVRHLDETRLDAAALAAWRVTTDRVSAATIDAEAWQRADPATVAQWLQDAAAALDALETETRR